MRMSVPDRRTTSLRGWSASAAALAVSLLVSGTAVASATERMYTIALFPVENLTGELAPVDDVARILAGHLAASGVTVLGPDVLEAFFARNRVRYTGGLDGETARALRKEAGVDGVVIASLELAGEIEPPKFALTVRLISTTEEPVVVWADDAGLAGDDAPGLFELGLINDFQTLAGKGLDRLGTSLVTYLKTGDRTAGPKRATRFRPKMFYNGLALEPDKTHTIAIVPFFNVSDRRNAGEILALLFLRHLADVPQFSLLDTGVVRRQLLDARIIMDGGLSITDGETVAALLEADYVLGGRVIRYLDSPGSGGTVRVEFSTVMIERRSRRVVWSSASYNEGAEGVRTFNRGIVNTAHAMATQMVRLTADMMTGRER